MTYFILGLIVGFVVGKWVHFKTQDPDRFDEIFETSISGLDPKKYKVLAAMSNGQSAWAIVATRDRKIEVIKNEGSIDGSNTFVIKSSGNRSK